MNLGRAWGAAGLLSALVLAQASAGNGSASWIEFTPAQVRTGGEVGYGQCPCLRWTLQFAGLGGRLETRDFIISSDALLALDYREDPRFQGATTDLVRFGGLEALLKGTRLGLRFQGVTVGNDLDRGYTDILRTGLSFVMNLVQQERVRLDLRSGYDFERMRLNLVEDVERHDLPQSLNLIWNAGRWSGDLRGSVSIPTSEVLSPAAYRLQASASSQVRVLTVQDLRMALGAALVVDRDPQREEWGLAPLQATAQFFMNMSWVPRAAGRAQ